jgi:hypothetical protein
MASTADQDRITRELLEKVREPYRQVLEKKGPVKRYTSCNDWFAVRELQHKMDAMLEALKSL